MKRNIDQVIEMAKNNESLEGVAIVDLQETQVRAVDALLLAEHGVLLPEQNIYYSDEEIAYDPEFDEVEWSEEPLQMSWEEKFQLAEQINKHNEKEEVTYVEVKISDLEVRQWVNDNYEKVGEILENFIVDIYKANKIMNGR